MKMKALLCILSFLGVGLFGPSQELYAKDNSDLYQVSAPYDTGYLQVSDIHHIYYAQFGNPHGMPIVVLHGGPGAGCSDSWSSFFDLSFYRVVMFDQRGAYRSRPF